jgi:hypothetical protein
MVVKATIRAVQIMSPDQIQLTVEYNLKYTSTGSNITLPLQLTRFEFTYWKDANPTGTLNDFVMQKIKDIYTRVNTLITATAGLEGKTFDW